MKIVFGSHSFGLTTPKSDIDIATFIFPTIEQLYDGTVVNEMTTSLDEDNRTMDFRIIGNMFEKTISMNLVDYCTSQMIEMDEDEKEIMDTIHEYIDEYTYIRRYSFALNLLAYGREKLKEAVKISESRRMSIEATGYDRKSLATFYRNYIIIQRLLSDTKMTARDYIYFHDGDKDKEFLKDLKISETLDYEKLYNDAISLLEETEKNRKIIIDLKIKEESKENLVRLKEITTIINEKIRQVILRRIKKA